MKNRILLIVTTIISVSAVLYSCKKEDSNKISKDNEIVLSQESSDLIKKIKDFKASLHTKSGEALSINDVQSNIEAALNYTYAEAEKGLQDVKQNRFSIFVPLNADNNVNMEDVSDAYDLVLENIRTHYHSFFIEEKNLVSVNIETSESESSKSGNTVELVVTSKVNLDLNSFIWTFQDYDYWCSYGAEMNSGGYCSGPYDGQKPDLDAAEMLQKLIHIRKPMPTIPRYFYSPIQHKTACYNEFDNFTGNDPVYLLYRTGTCNDISGECLSPDYLKFYLYGSQHIIYSYENETNPGKRPVGYNFVSCDVRCEMIGMKDLFEISHEIDIEYGVLHESNDPIEGL
ncbi:MAG: hypothetical protein JEZ03_02555 [Bacteroidales bacterium]|nr:hypothetical protein [Bacteroidales bacterium]